MIPEKYDTMVWGLIVILVVVACTVSLLVAIDRAHSQPDDDRIIHRTPLVALEESW